MNGSTVLTIGTALSRAEQAGASVSALVQGQWIAGRVLGIDGHGVVLANEDGESAVLRLEQVAVVRIDSGRLLDVGCALTGASVAPTTDDRADDATACGFRRPPGMRELTEW